MQHPLLRDVEVSVNRVMYTPEISQPDLPYGFVYYITIYNKSPHIVQILGRKWIVTEADGRKLVVEGEGVVGEAPILEPGEAFTYNSCHVVASDSTAAGLFYGVILEGGQSFVTSIPKFSLTVPS